MRPFVPLLLGWGVMLGGCQPDASTAPPASSPNAATPLSSINDSSPLLLGPEDLLVMGQDGGQEPLVLSGAIVAARKADLRAEVSAVVLQTWRENGERVRKGEVLVSLDASVLRENLASAEESARSSARGLDSAERQYQRLKALQGQGMVSLQALEDAELRRHAAQSEAIAAQARVSAARQQLERTRIRAPFDGVLSARKVSVGDNVQAGRELAQVIDPASTRFEGWATAAQVTALRPGQVAALQINGWTQTPLHGRIRHIDASAHPLTRQVGVLVDFETQGPAPMVGLYAEARIEVLPARTAPLSVPDSALIREGGQTFVWQWLPEGRLQRQAVRLGERNTRLGKWPVLDGLQAGDHILRHPGNQLSAGMPARLRSTAAQ